MVRPVTWRLFALPLLALSLWVAVGAVDLVGDNKRSNVSGVHEGVVSNVLDLHDGVSNSSKVPISEHGAISITDDKNDINANATDNLNDTNTFGTNAVLLYRRLFRQKRESQKEAVKVIVAMESYEKQSKMIKMILTKLFTVLLQSKVRLTEAGYMPGDPFPTTDEVKDALSMVLENTAFVSDILLRLPDATHALLKDNREWSLMVEWAVRFCNDTSIFEGSDLLLLDTVAQELNLLDRNPDYINPYRRDIQTKTKQADSEVDKMVAEAIKKAKRERERKEKRKHKGPRMSSVRRDEL